MIYVALFHGLKLGFEYLPELGSGGTLIFEIAFLRIVLIFDSAQHPDAPV